MVWGKDNAKKIIREDILRLLGEKGDSSIDEVKAEAEASEQLISNVLDELKRENLVYLEGEVVKLTNKGIRESEYILKRHLALEKLFRKLFGEEKAHYKAHMWEHHISDEMIRKIADIDITHVKKLSLEDIQSSEEVLIADIEILDNNLIAKAIGIGILPGVKVSVIYRTPDYVVICIGSKKIVLDDDIAKKVIVIAYE